LIRIPKEQYTMRPKEQGSGDAQAGKTGPEVARGADLADLASFVGLGK